VSHWPSISLSSDRYSGEDWPPPPLPVTGAWVRTDPFPSPIFYLAGCLFNLSSKGCLISTQNQCHMDLWSVWLVLTHHHPFIDFHSPFTRTLWESRLLPTVFDLFGCLELFSNCHLSVLRECSPWVGFCSHGPASSLTVMRTVWVDSSLTVVFELVLRLLASDKKDQPPLPDRPENHLDLSGLDQDDPPWPCTICSLSA
jgi:hypothetical protein